MSRVARRIHIATIGAEQGFDPDQCYLETALRSRAARKVRAHLRRMDPVVVRTPRWSAPASFMEDLALDLAVGEPAIGCRTVSFRPLKGRTVGEAWQFTLALFGQLGRRDWHPAAPATVADRRGFRWAMEQQLEQAHAESPHRVALLAHGAEHLPVEIIEDITWVWHAYCDRHPEGRRCTLLLAGAVDADWVRMGESARVDLADFGEAEAAAAIVGRAGPMPFHHLESVARFTGGVPGLVEQIGLHARAQGRLPMHRQELLGALGGVADEMRGVVDIVASQGELWDRLQQLMPGAEIAEVPELDAPLVTAGLVRRIPNARVNRVSLRAPAIIDLLG